MLRITFMYDCHVFGRFEFGNRTKLIEQAIKYFREDGCGSLFVRDELGGTQDHLTLHGKRLDHRDNNVVHRPGSSYGQTIEAIEEWSDAVLAEESFRRTMAA